MLTLQELQSAVPVGLRTSVTQDFVDRVNGAASDPIVAENIRNNCISYTGVLKEGRFKLEDYLNAVTFVSWRLMGMSAREAYMKTFPQRYQALVARGAKDKDIAAYVGVYNSGKLVQLILEQTLTPTWVLNHDIYQKAINTQADLMMNAKSEKVRSDAANSILTHLKRPEKAQVEISIGEAENSGMKELRDMLTSLAVRQQELITKGAPTQEIAHQRLVPRETDIVDAEAIEVTGGDLSDDKNGNQ